MLELTLPTMTCGACEKRVRKALGTVPGIENIAVDLPTHKVRISGTAAAEEVARVLTAAGYPAAGA